MNKNELLKIKNKCKEIVNLIDGIEENKNDIQIVIDKINFEFIKNVLAYFSKKYKQKKHKNSHNLAFKKRSSYCKFCNNLSLRFFFIFLS